MSRTSRIVLVALVLLAALFRTNGLFQNTFFPDEALFASWAREIAVWRDPLLASQMVDKPPLLFYLQALFYPLMGPEMWAARFPNYIASLALIPLTAVLAWRLYRNQATALLAAGFITFSPMAIQFSSSGFIDPLLSCLVVASLALMAGYCVVRPDRFGSQRKLFANWSPFASGLMAGLAILSKHQAWLFIPLLVGVATIIGWRRGEWWRWLLGFLPSMGLQAGWEYLRGDEISLLVAQLQSYGGLRLAWSWELWPRLQAWAFHWAHVLRSPVLEMAILLAIPLIVAVLIDQHDRSAALDRLLVIFAVAYSLVLWFVAVPVWDRYAFVLLPFVGLVLARIVWRITEYAWSMISAVFELPMRTKYLGVLLPLGLMAFQASGVIEAYRGDLPVGATPSADQGVSQISPALLDKPYGTVLYDHWYSWQWRYHLFDGKVHVSWFADPDRLVEDLHVFGGDGNPRFIALPDSGQAGPVRRAINKLGFSLVPIEFAGTQGQDSGITLFRIESPR